MGIHMKNSVNYTGGGMGVGATKLELTLDEYEALTPEEKNNGTMYFLTDVNGDGEQFQPIIYSEDEHEIGVWTDGRPIYEKTVVNTLALTSSWQQYIPASDFAVVISAEGIYRRSGEYVSNAFSQYAIAAWILRDGYIQVGINGGENDWEIVALTIRYTKSTDRPGSGQWTPQGVPTHHYSTNEQIVGTWIDGSTIYERTHVFETEITNVSSTSWTDTGISNAGIDKMIGGAVGTNTDGTSYHFNISMNIDNNLKILGCRDGAVCQVKYLTFRYTKTSPTSS